MPGEVSRSNKGPGNDTPLVPSWMNDECECGVRHTVPPTYDDLWRHSSWLESELTRLRTENAELKKEVEKLSMLDKVLDAFEVSRTRELEGKKP